MSQFRIQEKISESGSTTVYRAFQEALDRPILLKVLHQHLASDPVVRERFTREAKACAHLRSEHIVQVYDLTEYNGCPAIVMEYVQGRSLKEVIAAPPSDREQIATKTAIGILRALSLAHRRGIVHRDIKPGNILLADDGTIKLTDFGLAHVAHSPTVTIEGTVLGTPAYMSPEQVQGERVDARTDFFSLGVTLVEILTGERIFEGSTYSECIRKIVEFRTGHLDRLMSIIPPARVAFLKRIMEPNPNDRYQSAAEALNELGEKEDETGPSNGTRSSRRYLFPLLSLTAAVVIVSLFYLFLPRHPQKASPEQSINDEQPADSVAHISAGEPTRTDPSPVDTKKNTVAPSRSERSASDRSAVAVVPTPDSAKIVFTSNPWAKVFVDGKLVGETPLAQPVYLKPGRHSVTFSNPSFDPIMKTIEVHAGGIQTVTADFLQNAGFLVCAVQPWAEVYVDQQYKDTTPLSKPIILSAGLHRIRFHNAAFIDTMQVVTIKARDTLSLSVSLRSPR
jgi:serine/threonine protein kinase